MENPFEEKKIRRPDFLTVLCILTFIGSGWTVLSSIFSIFTAGTFNHNAQMERYMNTMEDQGSNSFISGLMNSSMEVLHATQEHAKTIALIQLLLALISLLGAIFMFWLKRSGFYFYTTAQVLMLFVLPAFVGFSFVTAAGMLLGGVFTALFITLYAINLKYMIR